MNTYTLKATEMPLISSHFYLNLPMSWRMQEQPEPSQLQCAYGGQRSVEFNSAHLKSRTPCSCSWLLHHKTVGFLHSTGKSRTRVPWPKPTTQWVLSKRGRSVLTWETFPWTQVKPRSRPASGANVAKYSKKPETSVSSPSSFSWTFYPARTFEC